MKYLFYRQLENLAYKNNYLLCATALQKLDTHLTLRIFFKKKYVYHFRGIQHVNQETHAKCQ